MAVPPAPGDDAVGDQSDSPDPTPRDHDADHGAATRVLSARTRRTVVRSAAGVVVACLLVSAFWVLVRGDGFGDVTEDPHNPQTDRDRVMAVAKSFVTQFATYGPEDLDGENRMPGYVERVEKFLTPKFTTSFEQSVTFAEHTVAQQQISRSGLVYAVGVSRLEDDSARVLVAGRDSIEVPDPDDPDQLVPYSDQTFRYEVALVRTGGEWLVDNFGPVGTLDGGTPELPEGLPTGEPTRDPSGSGSPSGSGGNGNGDGGEQE